MGGNGFLTHSVGGEVHQDYSITQSHFPSGVFLLSLTSHSPYHHLDLADLHLETTAQFESNFPSGVFLLSLTSQPPYHHLDLADLHLETTAQFECKFSVVKYH